MLKYGTCLGVANNMQPLSWGGGDEWKRFLNLHLCILKKNCEFIRNCFKLFLHSRTELSTHFSSRGAKSLGGGEYLEDEGVIP